MPKLTLYFPPEFDDPAWAGSSFCLDAPGGDHKHGRAGEWVLGRHPAADVTIASRTVSARHAAIAYSYAADRWSIQDLGSTNGTRINSELLSPKDWHPIKLGDRLALGGNLIHLVEDEEDTIGDDGPTTIASSQPLDHRTGETIPPTQTAPPAKTYADAVYLGVSWLFAPSTLLGKIYRLVVLAVAVVVVVAVMGGAS